MKINVREYLKKQFPTRPCVQVYVMKLVLSNIDKKFTFTDSKDRFYVTSQKAFNQIKLWCMTVTRKKGWVVFYARIINFHNGELNTDIYIGRTNKNIRKFLEENNVEGIDYAFVYHTTPNQKYEDVLLNYIDYVDTIINDSLCKFKYEGTLKENIERGLTS